MAGPTAERRMHLSEECVSLDAMGTTRIPMSASVSGLDGAPVKRMDGD